MQQTRLYKLERRLELLLEAKTDIEGELSLYTGQLMDVGRNVAMTKKEIYHEREKSKRDQLLPTTITVGNCTALASVNGVRVYEKPGPEEAPPVEEEAQPESKEEGESLEAGEQVGLEVPCWKCKKPEPIAQLMRIEGADGRIVVPLCEPCYQEIRVEKYPNMPEAAKHHQVPRLNGSADHNENLCHIHGEKQ